MSVVMQVSEISNFVVGLLGQTYLLDASKGGYYEISRGATEVESQDLIEAFRSSRPLLDGRLFCPADSALRRCRSMWTIASYSLASHSYLEKSPH